MTTKVKSVTPEQMAALHKLVMEAPAEFAGNKLPIEQVVILMIFKLFDTERKGMLEEDIQLPFDAYFVYVKELVLN